MQQTPHRGPPKRDVTTRDGAELLARELNAWWHDRGHSTVQHWIEPMAVMRRPAEGDERSGGRVWCVRSNLVNGLPPP